MSIRLTRQLLERSRHGSKPSSPIKQRRALLLAAAAWPVLAWVGAVRAQSPAKIRRIGLLSSVSPADAALWHEAFRLGLRERGWIEGKNISIEYRYSEGISDRFAELAADLVRLKADVIVTSTAPAALAVQKATKAIPIVMVTVGDPVVSGLIESLARPGGNVTGLSQMTFELGGKRLELLKEMVPGLSRVAVLWNPESAVSTLSWKGLQIPARQLRLELHSLEVRGTKDLDKAFEAATRARAGALLLAPAGLGELATRTAVAAKSRLPSIYQWSEFADLGGLMSYGPERADMYRRAATFVDKLLRGAKPADLPVEQPTKFELVVNMRTAKALGITVPQTILIRADRLIE